MKESSTFCCLLKSRVNNEEKTPLEESPLEETKPEVSDDTESYTINKSFTGRLQDIAFSIIGNGYELVAKPHTATWIVVFFALVLYYTCFINKPGEFPCFALIPRKSNG